MRRVIIPTVLLLLCSAVMGATVFREQVAQAAQAVLQVRVVNTAAEPVPVREVGTQQLQPVQVLTFGSFASGSRFSSEETLYTVPAGKTLAIQAFTVSSNLAADDQLNDARLDVELTGFSDIFTWFLHPTDEGVAATGARVFRGSAQVTAYAGPGTTVVASASRDGASLSSTSIRFDISGYLVDTP